jgi:3-hydroxyisobutyrate dehydrogenase
MTNMDRTKKPVAFIGLGIMGAHMAGHILAAGHPLHVFNRTRAKADPLVARGATWHDSPGNAAAAADFVITMIGFPRDVEDVYLGDGEIVARTRPNTILIDMTTSSPSLAKRIATAAKARGVLALDAPVSGGESGACDAKLSIMVGGDAEAFAAALPVLQLMGPNVVLQGEAGAGQHTKMSNQIVIAGTMLGVAEGLAYAKRAGLDPKSVLRSIGTGAAGAFLLNNLGPKMLAGDFAPGFFIEHFLKDLSIALAEAHELKLDLEGARTAAAQYAKLAEAGRNRDGTQALFQLYSM